MRWSKLKQKIEENFSNSLKGKVEVYSTAYGNCSCGRAWFTYNGETIANFCTRAFYNRFVMGDPDQDMGLTQEQVKKYRNQFVEYGENSRQDIYEIFWNYVHELDFETAIQSECPIVQSLVVLDERLGKRRYERIEKKTLHSLAKKLFEIREQEEKTESI